ncbi:MAG: phage replisome organizer N-terminal domain-containing protein, partial [Anaerolineaceae bacterium]|nr:phage replisome organizer N-terminal domain-containing protein [Anaerolineaceae bacterium]
MAKTPSWAWCRLYNETPEDKKLARIARVVNVQRVVVLGVWSGLLAIANGSPKRGSLMLTEDMPYLPDELADMIGIELEQFNSIIKAMLDIGMVLWDDDCLVIDKFTARNPESDSSAERVRRFRARKAADEEPETTEEEETEAAESVTSMKRYGNVTVTPPEKETESEKEKEGEGERIAVAAEILSPLQEAFVQEADLHPPKKPKSDWQVVF